jgi:hypothetical protein
MQRDFHHGLFDPWSWTLAPCRASAAWTIDAIRARDWTHWIQKCKPV